VTDTAVCLGGTVPRAQLDVRGSARVDGKLAIGYFGSADNEALAPLDVRGDYIQSSTYANGTVSTAARFGSSDGTLHVSSIKTSNGAETLALQTTIDNKTMEYNIENGWTYGADSRHDLCLQPYKGNVGIGTTNPSDNLHVNTTLRAGFNRIQTGSGNATAGNGVYIGTNMNGSTGGGAVQLTITAQTSTAAHTGVWVYILRKYYSDAHSISPWTAATNIFTSNGSSVTGIVLYTDTSGKLKFYFTGSNCNYKWSVIELI
jgi:hypothetical protein